MSKRKKKKKLARKKALRRPRSSVCDMHHLCWTRRNWSSPLARSLRLHPYCIVSIPKNTLHWYIHQNMEKVPVPDQKSLAYAIKQLEMMELVEEIRPDDPIEKRLRVLANLFDTCDQRTTANAFRRQLQIVCEFSTKKAP